MVYQNFLDTELLGEDKGDAILSVLNSLPSFKVLVKIVIELRLICAAAGQRRELTLVASKIKSVRVSVQDTHDLSESLIQAQCPGKKKAKQSR